MQRFLTSSYLTDDNQMSIVIYMKLGFDTGQCSYKCRSLADSCSKSRMKEKVYVLSNCYLQVNIYKFIQKRFSVDMFSKLNLYLECTIDNSNDTINSFETIDVYNRQVSVLIIALTPRFSKKIPGSLIAIIVVTIAVYLICLLYTSG